MARIRLEPLRGFRDILHPESAMLTRLAEVFAEEAEKHGYEEVKPPTLERFELFALKSGEEIRRSMYVFRDKAGREVALRPEATASIARIYLKHLRGKPKPLRLYYIVNCFRYEEPQKARYREFWQAGIELLGVPGVEGDFEAVKLLLRFYERIGVIDRIVLKLGNTRIYRRIFSKYNVPEDLQDHILHLMDKGLYTDAERLVEEKIGGKLASLLHELWNTSRSNPSEAARVLGEEVPEAAEAVEELERIASMVRAYSSVKLDVDMAFARGLAYYTGIIFEVKVPGFPVSIAGGGRYDNLISLYGDEEVPGTGFAIGLDRTLAALIELGLANRLLVEKKRVGLAVLEPELVPYAARVQDIIAEKGYQVILHVEKKLGKLMSKLAKHGYHYTVIIGKREAAEGRVVVRDMLKRTQATVELEALKHASSLENLLQS